MLFPSLPTRLPWSWSGDTSNNASVTVSWQVAGAFYVTISPAVGATRGTSASVLPTRATAYTLRAANAYGQTTSSVRVTVH